MSTVKLPSTTKKRQKGVVAQPITSRPVDVKRPGKSVGTGPGQGKMEGEGVDALEQHRLDSMQAPPVLRVEESPPPPGSNIRGRGGFQGRGGARGRGGVEARGRGRGAARGGGARATDLAAMPRRGDGGWGARGSSHVLPIRPSPQSFGPTGVIPRPPGMGSRPRPPPFVTPSAAGPSGSSVAGPSRQSMPPGLTTRPTYPSLRPVVLLSAQDRAPTRPASPHPERKPNISTQNRDTPPAPPVQKISRNYAPAGAYARVMQGREPDQNSSPSYSPRLESEFIIRDEDAYSPSRPTLMDLDADDLGSEMPSRSQSKKAQGKQREVQSTSTPEGRRDNPVDVDLDTDDDDAEQEVFVPVAQPTQPIVDYTSQVKIESGCTDDIDELEDEEEAEPEPEDDSMKQSSTLVYLKSSNRPEVQDCWSKDSKVREFARTSAYCVAANELSEKNRRPTGSIWRDDGLAVDWVLDHRAGSMHFMFPRSMAASKIDARRVWMEERMISLRQKFPSRRFGLPITMDRKMCVFWTDPSTRNDVGLSNNPDPTEPPEVGQPGIPVAKRARSPSPTTSRKAAKTSTTLSANNQMHQTAEGHDDGIVPAADNHQGERLPGRPLESAPSFATSLARSLKPFLQDLDSSVIQSLSDFVQSNQELAPIGERKPKKLSNKYRKHLIAFTTDLLKTLDKRKFQLLPNLYHEKSTFSLVPSEGEGQGSIPAGEPALNYCKAMSKQALSKRDNFMDAIGPMRYSNIVEAGAVTQSLVAKRAKKGGIWGIRLHGYFGKLHKDRHFLWSYHRILLVMVDYMGPGLPKQYHIVTDYMITKRHGEANLPPGWHWISETPPIRSSSGIGHIATVANRFADAPQVPSNEVVPLGATDTSGRVPGTLPIQTHTASEAQGRASQGGDPVEQSQPLDSFESGHSPMTLEEGGEADSIPLQIEDAASGPGENAQSGTVESAADDEQDSLQKRMETALGQQDTWQEIRAAAPNARAAVKKLAELEEEIVALHMRLVALRKRSTPQPPVLAIEPPATTTSTTATGGVSDLKLAGGVAHPFSRMAGDKIRFMLKNPAQIQSCDIAVYSMRGVVQHVSDKPANAKSRAVSTILENGLRVVDGCMPTSGKVVMVVERNAVVPISKNPQQLLLWDQDEQGTPRQAFLPKAPHTGNPSCVVSIGCDDDGSYRFASGGTTDRNVILWDIKDSGATNTSIVQSHSSAVRSLAFDAHGRLFGGTTSGQILLQDLGHRQSGGARSIYVHAAIFHIHTSPASHSIAVEAEQTRDQFYVFDIRGSSKRPTHRFGFDINTIPKATLSKFDKGSSEGHYFARGYGDGTVRMWDLRMVRRKPNQENPYMVAKASNDPIRHVVLDGRKLRVLTQTAITTYELPTRTR